MIRIGSTSHKVTSEQYSKSKQKDLFELEKQLEKSRLAVVQKHLFNRKICPSPKNKQTSKRKFNIFRHPSNNPSIKLTTNQKNKYPSNHVENTGRVDQFAEGRNVEGSIETEEARRIGKWGILEEKEKTAIRHRQNFTEAK